MPVMQFACAEATSSRGTFNSSKPFNLTTQISQQYAGRQLPDGVNVTSLGDISKSRSFSHLAGQLSCIKALR